MQNNINNFIYLHDSSFGLIVKSFAFYSMCSIYGNTFDYLQSMEYWSNHKNAKKNCFPGNGLYFWKKSSYFIAQIEVRSSYSKYIIIKQNIKMFIFD